MLKFATSGKGGIKSNCVSQVNEVFRENEFPSIKEVMVSDNKNRK